MSNTATGTKPRQWNVPNVLTGVRMVLVPVFGWMLLAHGDPAAANFLSWRYATTAVFIVAILTDTADGWIARRYNLVTNFGKLWDPIADKALTGMAFVGLSILGELPWWVTIIILVREWGVTVLRWAVLKYGVMAANRGGKAKTLTQSIALIVFLVYLPHLPVAVQWTGWIIMGLAFVLTVVTGIDYCIAAWRLRRAGQASDELSDQEEADL
jgi:CDP-diacylglycerol---glycerol-3-phosphate 3-phosphatidyltransferase